jgi:hypothetical protein
MYTLLTFELLFEWEGFKKWMSDSNYKLLIGNRLCDDVVLFNKICSKFEGLFHVHGLFHVLNGLS